MDKFGKSQSVKRFEDRRFLTGGGGYVDDIAPEGALTAVFVRSDIAHGTITSVDLDDARAMPGVKLAMAAEGLAAMGVTYDMTGELVDNRDGTKGQGNRLKGFYQEI